MKMIVVYAASVLILLTGCAVQKNLIAQQDSIRQTAATTSGHYYLNVGFDLLTNDAIGPLKIDEDSQRVTKKLGEAEEKDPADTQTVDKSANEANDQADVQADDESVDQADVQADDESADQADVQADDASADQAGNGSDHRTWQYPSKGIELGLARDTGKLKIDMITVTSPCEFSTKRGIKIGSSREEVLSAYKKEIDPDGFFGDTTKIMAGSTNGGILFTIDNGKVGSIFMGAAAK